MPGIGFAELGPADLSLALGYREMPRGLDNYPPEMREARERVLAACRTRGIAFLEACTPETVATRIDEGVRVVAGHREDTARAGRAYQKRTMPAAHDAGLTSRGDDARLGQCGDLGRGIAELD